MLLQRMNMPSNIDDDCDDDDDDDSHNDSQYICVYHLYCYR